MSQFRFFLLATTMLLAAGCTASVSVPTPKIKLPGVEVELDGGGGPGFCPPGQAMKGNC